MAPVTIAALDSQLARALGLRAAARRFAEGARQAGLTPPSRFGTEVVARLLELRTNHSDDAIELGPADIATRAEAAYSAARILWFDGTEVPPSARRQRRSLGRSSARGSRRCFGRRFISWASRTSEAGRARFGRRSSARRCPAAS